MRSSICYMVPFYSGTDDQHFAHLPRLLTEVAKLCDLYVIVQRGGVSPDISGAKMILVQERDPRWKVRRFFELLSLVRRVRRAGCRRFFVRISAGAALTLISARRLIGLEAYYGKRERPKLCAVYLTMRSRSFRHRLEPGSQARMAGYLGTSRCWAPTR